MRHAGGHAERKRANGFGAVLCCIVALSGVGPDRAATAAAGAPSGTPPATGCTIEIRDGDVQEAIDRVSSAGGPVTVCLASGEFRLPRFLSLERDHLTLRGQGSSTVLRLADGVQSPVIVVGDYRHRVPERTTSSVSIARLRIVGGGRGGSESQADHPYLTNSAVVVRAGREVDVSAVEISGCRSACVLTEYGTERVSIDDSTISGATWDGISLNRTARARLAGNTIRGNTAAGITAEHLEDSVIERNVISDNGSHGVYLSDSRRNRFLHNRFSHNTNAGVFLTCAVRYRDPGPVLCWTDSMSQANVFEGNQFAGNRLAYIVAADAAANCGKRGAVPNVSRGDRFGQDPRIEQHPERFGLCLQVSGEPSRASR